MGGIGIPKDAKIVDGRPHVELTDEFHQDEPLAYLVKRCDDTIREYDVFENYRDACNFAARQSEEHEERNGEPRGFDVYPLYASHAVFDGDW